MIRIRENALLGALCPSKSGLMNKHIVKTSSSRSHDHRLLIAMASLAGGMLGRCDIDEETSGSATASRSQKVPMFQHMFMRSQRGGDISILKIEGPQDRDDEGTTVSTLYSSTYVHEFIFETRRKPLSTDGWCSQDSTARPTPATDVGPAHP